MKTLKDLDVKGKKVLLRLDLNMPIVRGKITDLYRLTQALPTIKWLIANEAKILILSHYGRPNGKFNTDMSLSTVVNELKVVLGGKDIKFGVNILSSPTINQIQNLKNGEVIILENLRFYKEEENNNLDFAQKIANLGDIYINDAFSCSHREHASIVSIPKFLPSAAGLSLSNEINSLENYLISPQRKIMSITGGAKVSSKIDLLKKLVEKSDYLVVGGAMANTFLKANNLNVGKSMYEEEYTGVAREVMAKAKQSNCELILPQDVITAASLSNESSYSVKTANSVLDDEMILDVGPRFLAHIIHKLNSVKTVIWNGPLGAFEHKPFDIGTITIARAISEATTCEGVISIAGGGDVVSAINSSGLNNNFTYISTGGGAFLKWMEGKLMPGIKALAPSCTI